MTSPSPVIYFAGKIGQHDWRSVMLDDGRIGGLSPDWTKGDLFNPAYSQNMGAFDYGGPFFVSCDHGCAHIGGVHGANLASNCFGSTDSVEQLRRRIWQVNHERLKRADLVLAYVNESDCYGTLVELGMAQSRKKRIVIGFGTDIPHSTFDDLWMARQAVEQVYRGTPKQIWRDFQADFLDGSFWSEREAWQRATMDHEFSKLESAK